MATDNFVIPGLDPGIREHRQDGRIKPGRDERFFAAGHR